MNALAKIGRIIRCDWGRYETQDDEEEYSDLMQRASVANAVSQYEQHLLAEEEKEEEQQLAEKSPCGLISGLFRSGTASNNVTNNSNNQRCSTTTNNQLQATIRAEAAKRPTCMVCEKRIYPTDESTTARGRTYHTSCFKCTLCKCKLKNHPDESHELIGDTFLILQCSRCKLENEHRYKDKQLSRVAGERIVVEDEEQGDIDQVVEAIGDELEEAIYAMIPRCAVCGGDFLKYKGEISIVGSLKYHKECFLTGKPPSGTASLTMDPTQAAKYLPEDIILKLSNAVSGKVVSTLFFIWKDREEELKSMRHSLEQKDRLSVLYQLDSKARANPNHPSNQNNPKKTSIALPSSQSANSNGLDLKLDLVGADQIAPQPPSQLGDVSVSPGHQYSSALEAKIGYSKYNLQHVLSLRIPCNPGKNTLEVLGAELEVRIEDAGSQSPVLAFV